MMNEKASGHFYGKATTLSLTIRAGIQGRHSSSAASSLRRSHLAILEDDDKSVNRIEVGRWRRPAGRRLISAILPTVAVAIVATVAYSYCPLSTRVALERVVAAADCQKSSRFAHALVQFNLLSKRVLIEF